MHASLVASVVGVLYAGHAVSFGKARAPATYFVSSCDDHGYGSLRDALAWTQSGETIDLTSLPGCSTIILTTGALVTAHDDVTLVGPGAASLTIASAHESRLFTHNGSGLLSASGITFADGSFDTDGAAIGGCIYSKGTVDLRDAVVSGCQAKTSSYDLASDGCGGGVFADYGVVLDRTRIVDNRISIQDATYSFAQGAGICSRGSLAVSRSVISGNVLDGPATSDLVGAGAYAAYDATITASTIASNVGGGLWLSGYPSIVSNSTVSGNSGGGIAVRAGIKIYNSTIAFNSGMQSASAAGLRIASGGVPVVIQSSIIAGNLVDGVPIDVSAPASVSIDGSANLIVAADVPLPPDTLSGDPMLAPLGDNGGLTPTHAVLPGSPAIDAGENLLGLASDQRGTGYERVSGSAPDIGAFEAQPDVVFVNGFD
jgi:hypothetical protein